MELTMNGFWKSLTSIIGADSFAWTVLFVVCFACVLAFVFQATATAVTQPNTTIVTMMSTVAWNTKARTQAKQTTNSTVQAKLSAPMMEVRLFQKPFIVSSIASSRRRRSLERDESRLNHGFPSS